MKLSTLFSNQPDIEITGLAMDSRRVKTGNVFFCIEGLEADGHDFAGKAVEAGAVAIVHSKDIPEQKGIVYIKSNHVGDECFSNDCLYKYR